MKVVIKYTIVFLLALFVSLLIFNTFKDKNVVGPNDFFVAGSDKDVIIYNENLEQVTKIIRGSKVKSSGKELQDEAKSLKYQEIEYENNTYYILKDNLVKSIENIVLETNRYIRTPVTVYEEENSSKILSFIPKGEEVEVLDFNEVSSSGEVEC